MKKFGLSKKERIKSKKDFGVVYSEGKTIYSKNQTIKATYTVHENTDSPGLKCAFAVHKKSGTSVWRNRVKRLLRESYRTNKIGLLQKCLSRKYRLLIIFSLNSINQQNTKKIYLKDVLPEIVNLIHQIENGR